MPAPADARSAGAGVGRPSRSGATHSIEAESREVAIDASAALARRLSRRPEIEWVRRGPSDDLDEAFYTLYFPRRHLLLASTPEELERVTSDEGLRAAARDLRQRLASPTGTFVRQIAPQDPLLAFVRHLEGLRDAQEGGLAVVDGQLVTAEGQGVIFLASRASPFDGEASRKLLDGIARDFAAVNRAHGGALRLEQSGVHRFAVASQAAIEEDVSRISGIGTAGVLLLFLIVYRSLRHLAIGSIPLLVGGVFGLAVTQLVFGRVHGLGLAFGATLIGVGVDYVEHYMNHHTLAPSPDGPWGTMRRIWPGIALGATTTIAGLSGLAWTSFPGIRELAVLTSTGILAALLATRYLVPPWMPDTPKPTRIHLAMARTLERGLHVVRRSWTTRLAIPIIALVVCGLGIARLRWVDDVRVLNALDPALLAEDERVRERVSRMDSGRFVLAWGEDEETALRRNDEVNRRLIDAREAGELERFRSVHAFLPSVEEQRRSLEGLRSAPRLWERLSAALEAEGFVVSAFEPFRQELRGDASPPLTWAELEGSPIGPLVESFRVDLGADRIAFITMLRGGDVDALEARLRGLEGVRLFDQTRFLEGAYGRFRSRTMQMIGVGLVAVFLLLLVRYRKLVPSLAAFLPAVLSAATSLSVLVLLGFEANLMHLVALLLVLSMGVDYGVFMVEIRDSDEGAGPTLSGILVACLTTVLSFGLLAMSENPALRALGAISGIGSVLSLVLAPTAWLFVRRGEK
jgi:predicted exporter